MNDLAHRVKYAELAYKIVGGLFFSCLKIPFSKRCNAMYGPENFFYHLALMCEGRTSAECVYQNKLQDEHKPQGGKKGKGRRGKAERRLVPCAKWTLGKIRGVRYDRMLIRCGHMIRCSVAQMRRRGMLRGPVDVAIDMHKIGRYDKSPSMTNMIKSKYKDGTCNFNCLATVQCVIDGSRATLGTILVNRGDFKTDVVSRLLDMCERNGVVLNLLTLDREFFTREIIQLLNGRGIRFLMPATKNKNVKKAIDQHEKGERGEVSYNLTTSDRQSEGYTLIIRRNERYREGDEETPKYHTFATNIPEHLIHGNVDGFVERYRQRWGIETGYRCYESVRPRTTSRSESVRMLLMFFPFLMYNAWIISKHLLMRRKLDGGGKKQTVTLKQTVRLFIRFCLESLRKGRPPDPE